MDDNLNMSILTLRRRLLVINLTPKYLYLGRTEYDEFINSLSIVELGRDKDEFMGMKVISVELESHLNVCP